MELAPCKHQAQSESPEPLAVFLRQIENLDGFGNAEAGKPEGRGAGCKRRVAWAAAVHEEPRRPGNLVALPSRGEATGDLVARARPRAR